MFNPIPVIIGLIFAAIFSTIVVMKDENIPKLKSRFTIVKITLIIPFGVLMIIALVNYIVHVF